jgi:ArsR family metal-binding transcriptional regulator
MIKVTYGDLKRCAELSNAFSLSGQIHDINVACIKLLLKELGYRVIMIGRRPVLIVRHSNGILMIEEDGKFNFSQIRDEVKAKELVNKIAYCSEEKSYE